MRKYLLLSIICVLANYAFAKDVTLKGYWYVYDYENRFVPGEGCWVLIWDSDLIWDDLIAIVPVNSSGYWTATFDNNSCFLCDQYDVFVVFATRGDRIAVLTNPDDMSTYFGFTGGAIIDNIASDHDYGSIRVTTELPPACNAFKVFTAIRECRSFLDISGTLTPSTICEFPTSEMDGAYFDRLWWFEFWPWADPAHINIPASEVLYGTTVMHEMGHNVMYKAFGDWLPAGGADHSFSTAISSEFAFMEGWPTFLQCCVRNDPAYVWGDGQRQRLEYSSQYTSSFWPTGDKSELRVAMGLWDPALRSENSSHS
jgi:hypothetical protein